MIHCHGTHNSLCDAEDGSDGTNGSVHNVLNTTDDIVNKTADEVEQSSFLESFDAKSSCLS